jgi:hypothetical protein
MMKKKLVEILHEGDSHTRARSRAKKKEQHIDLSHTKQGDGKLREDRKA